MTDTHGTPPNEEPTHADHPHIQEPAIDESPTMRTNPDVAREAAHPLAADTVVDASATFTGTSMPPEEVTQAAPFDVLAASAPTAQVTPARPYEHFGAPGDPAQLAFYQGMPPVAPQSGDPAAFYAQNVYIPQPGQPLPGQFGAPAPATKKRRTALWVAAAIIVLLLIGGGTTFAIVANQNASTPTKTLQKYCDGFKTQNAQEIYDTYSAASKQLINVSQVQQGFDLFKGFSNLIKITDCTVSDVQQNGTTATGTITVAVGVSFGGTSVSTSLSLTMKLVQENSEWKIDASSTSVPNLNLPTMPAFPTLPPDFLTPTVPSY